MSLHEENKENSNPDHEIKCKNLIKKMKVDGILGEHHVQQMVRELCVQEIRNVTKAFLNEVKTICQTAPNTRDVDIRNSDQGKVTKEIKPVTVFEEDQILADEIDALRTSKNLKEGSSWVDQNLDGEELAEVPGFLIEICNYLPVPLSSLRNVLTGYGHPMFSIPANVQVGSKEIIPYQTRLDTQTRSFEILSSVTVFPHNMQLLLYISLDTKGTLDLGLAFAPLDVKIDQKTLATLSRWRHCPFKAFHPDQKHHTFDNNGDGHPIFVAREQLRSMAKVKRKENTIPIVTLEIWLWESEMDLIRPIGLSAALTNALAELSFSCVCALSLSCNLETHLDDPQFFFLEGGIFSVDKNNNPLETVYCSKKGGVKGTTAYKIKNTDICLAVTVEVNEEQGYFGMAFIPSDCKLSPNLINALATSRPWGVSHFYAQAGEGFKTIEIRNIRANARMSMCPAIVHVDIGNF